MADTLDDEVLTSTPTFEPTQLPDAAGHFGRFGGRFMPEALVAALDELEQAWREARHDEDFNAELGRMLTEYAGVSRASCTRRSDCPSSSARASSSSARTSTTPARTRSATSSGRVCWPSGWARRG